MDDWKTRVELLEKEVQQLKLEVEALKSAHITPHTPDHQHVKVPPVKEKYSIFDKKPVAVKPIEVNTTAAEPVETKPKQSFEERLSNLLPKVFMFIFVLGVLWGLKLMSDYGYLNDGVKIALSYLLSVTIAVVAGWMVKNNKGAHNVRLALFGGSFIIGILATAAGVILYDVLSLTIALLIGIGYIAYGVWLTYWQANEGLTIFVLLVSLLLPYLLEYMSFNSLFIIGFILLLYAVMMWVMVKYKQKIALQVTMIFVGFSLATLSWMSTTVSILYNYGALLLLIIYSIGWVKMQPVMKRQALHIGLLFSIGTLGMAMFHTVESTDVEKMIVFACAAAISLGFWQWTRKLPVADVFATFALFAVLHIMLIVNVTDEWRYLLILTTAFIGIMIGIKQHATWMKLTQSIIFAIFAFAIYAFYGVEEPMPFLLNSLVVLFVVAILIYSERTAVIGRFSTALHRVRWTEVLRCIAVLLLLSMTYKYEVSPWQSTSYWMYAVIAIITGIVLFIPQRITKIVLPIFIMSLFSVASLLLWVDYSGTHEVGKVLITRLSYIIVTFAILYVLYTKRWLYAIYARWIEQSREKIMFVTSLFLLFHLWTFSRFIQFAFDLDPLVFTIATTTLLFAFATIYIVVGRRENFIIWTRAGFIFILLGIAKLIFIDLSTLDLIVRTIVFMVIGAIGLVLSNRLLKKMP